MKSQSLTLAHKVKAFTENTYTHHNSPSTCMYTTCLVCVYSKEFDVLYVRCIYTDRTQSRVGRRSVRGAFLSSSSRSAPPRDIMLEEPDVMNPGHTDMCVLPSVFVYIPCLKSSVY